MFDFSIYWKYLEIIIPTDFHIFERGSYTTNQISVSNDSHFHGGNGHVTSISTLFTIRMYLGWPGANPYQTYYMLLEVRFGDEFLPCVYPKHGTWMCIPANGLQALYNPCIPHI